jgi:anti-anti-sigma factor
MNVKTDTKEKFHVITIGETNMAANMTAELAQSLRSYLDKRVKNVVLNAKDIENLSDAAAETIVKIQQEFYEQNASFIVCSLRTSVSQGLDDAGLLELMHVTPTESEAGDIIQLEEIERELADSDDPAFDLG